jgi:hypothetical protein
VEEGCLINGSKVYVTNGAISDLALITAVSDPEVFDQSHLLFHMIQHQVGYPYQPFPKCPFQLEFIIIGVKGAFS